MQSTGELRELYTHVGPFATVYLDNSRNSATGAQEIERRWRGLRESLDAAGTDETTLGAIEEAVLAPSGLPGRHGRFLVAAGGRLLFDRPVGEPPDRSTASWDELPDLLPYLAATTVDINHVVVVTDRTGADIDVIVGMHKAARNHWGERHVQNRVDNAWADNASDVAAAVAERVSQNSAQLVVVAGEERSRSMVARDLAQELPTDFPIVQVDAGGRAAGSSDEALHQVVRDEVLKVTWRRRHELLEHLQQNMGRGEFARTGAFNVLDALRTSQADTVVLSDSPGSTLTAWVGPEPLQVGKTAAEVRSMGVDDPREVRFDAALTRAVVGSGENLEVAPNAHAFLPDGIAALLRFDDSGTG